MSPGLEPDLDQINAHLSWWFSGIHAGLIELGWTDPRSGGLYNYERFAVNEVAEMAERACEVNRVRGQNAYYRICTLKEDTPPRHAGDGDELLVPGYVVDADDDQSLGRLNAFASTSLTPSAQVMTGRHPTDRAQALWKIEDPTGWDPTLSKRLAKGLGSDPMVANPTTYLRIGGSVAWPTPKKPHRIPEMTEFTLGATRMYPGGVIDRQLGAAVPVTAGLSYDDWARESDTLDLEFLIGALSRGESRYNNCLSLTASLVARGYDDYAILDWVTRALEEGGGDASILPKMIRSARRKFTEEPEPVAQAPSGLVASPFQWVDPARIPPRQWLYGHHYIRRFLSSTTASGGVGKSSLVLVEAMSMATGADLLEATKDQMGWHKPILPQRSKVWMINLEDPLEEMQRRVMAAAIHYELDPASLAGLYLNSGRDTELVIARKMQNEVVIQEPVVEAIEASVKRFGVDVLIIDPFIHSHAVPENDNSELAVVVDAWRRLADKLNISIELIHHMRKLNGQEATHEDSRGAKALVDACRSVRALSKLTKDQGARLAIKEEDQAGLFYMGRGDKQNMAPSFSHDVWRRMIGVPLGNATVEYPAGDEVGVAVGWIPPQPDEGVTREHLFEIQRQLCNGDERKARAWQSKDWVGRLVAEVLQLDPDEHRKQIEKLLQIWIGNGALVTEVEWSSGGNKRREVSAGELAVEG